MTVAINKLVTLCRVPRRLGTVARLADRVARQRLAAELTQLVGPALSRQTAILRIRRLNVKLRLAVGQLSEDALVAAWSSAISQALFEALARADGSVPDTIVRAASVAEFRAAFLRDLLTGSAAHRWEYAEFAELLRLPIADAAVSLLLGYRPEIVATLIALAGFTALDNLLLRLDDLALERLFAAIPGAADRVTPLEPNDLLWTAQQVLRFPSGAGFSFDSRRLALRIFVQTKGGEGRLPRVIFQSLLALACLLEWPKLLQEGGNWLESPDVIEQRVGRRLPPAVLAVLGQLGREAVSGEVDSVSTGLRESLHYLRPLVPTAAPAGLRAVEQHDPSREVNSAGLLLLVGIVQRLGWDRLRDDALLVPWGGPRFFQVLLAGIGAAVLRPLTPLTHRLEPAVALFAGMEDEPDMVGLRHSLDSIDCPGRRRLLDRLLPESDAADSAIDWVTTFDALAARLIGAFTSRIRGFRDAPRAAIVRQFLLTPGRVRQSERVVSVLLDASPFHVALRISGMDDPLSSVNWMGGRRLEFRLLGT